MAYLIGDQKGRIINYQPSYRPQSDACQVPRAVGTMRLSTKWDADQSRLDGFRTSGALKAFFPRSSDLEVTLINTSGGVTGGDVLDADVTVGAGSNLTLTTQAAERAYDALSGAAQVTSRIDVQAGAKIQWLPQELILCNGCSLNRSLTVDMDADAEALIVEPVIFGRLAMGETLTRGMFRDHISITQAGRMIYLDQVKLQGRITDTLQHAVVAGGCGAMCSLIYVSPRAAGEIAPLRDIMPGTGGVTMLGETVLVMRLVAADSFILRQTLLPILDRLTHNQLPKPWRL
ncbi:MAG: urease accessory protein UreD [Pseudomonadota bacterium]